MLDTKRTRFAIVGVLAGVALLTGAVNQVDWVTGVKNKSDVPSKANSNTFAGTNTFNAGVTFGSTVALNSTVTAGAAGILNLVAGRFIPPAATFASAPSAPGTGQFFLFTDASSIGTCTGGGSAYALCRWNGSAWAAVTASPSLSGYAMQGVDINSSNQVTVTHLASALPTNQGGTGTTSTLSGIVRGGNPLTASELSGDATTSGSNAVTIATKYKTRTGCFDFGADNASSDLVDADIGPQGRIWMVPVAATVIEISVAANAGTPNVIVQRNRTGSATDLVSAALATGASGALACAATGAACLDGTAKSGSVSIVTSGSANVLAAGDWIQTKTGSSFASSGAKRLSVCVTYTVN